MNICVSVKSKYCKYLGVMLCSLLDNNSSERIEIFVLNNDLTEEDKELLSDIVVPRGGSVTFLKIDRDEFEEFSVTLTERYSLETFFRFKIPEIMPKDIDR